MYHSQQKRGYFRHQTSPNQDEARTPFTLSSYSPPAIPKTTAPTTPPNPIVTLAPPPVLSALAAATCSPNCVLTTALPFTVVVTTLVAVVLASHALHVIQGASVSHGPAVQPGQSVGGQAEPPHHAVQGADCQLDQEDQGPKGGPGDC